MSWRQTYSAAGDDALGCRILFYRTGLAGVKLAKASKPRIEL